MHLFRVVGQLQPVEESVQCRVRVAKFMIDFTMPSFGNVCCSGSGEALQLEVLLPLIVKVRPDTRWKLPQEPGVLKYMEGKRRLNQSAESQCNSTNSYREIHSELHQLLLHLGVCGWWRKTKPMVPHKVDKLWREECQRLYQLHPVTQHFIVVNS